MSQYQARITAANIERRQTMRISFDCPARFRTISGDREARLANLSEQGAKILIDSPPRDGMSGWLIFAGHELFCTVVWANSDACGVAFERPLSQQAFVLLAGLEAAASGPVARTGNIPLGRKRSGLLVAGNGE